MLPDSSKPVSDNTRTVHIERLENAFEDIDRMMAEAGA